ncbi:MAG: TIGR03013 family XrtA/PEP-CTERM system glycosyltransferase [Pseudomonadota bacterium]
MAHIRILRHYIHTQYFLTALAELVLLAGSAFAGYYTRYLTFAGPEYLWLFSLLFALVSFTCMSAMGVYPSRLREGYVGMMLRTAVSLFLLSTASMAILLFLFPELNPGRWVLLFTAVEAYVLLALGRWLTHSVLNEETLKRRVVVLGTGQRAVNVARRLRRRSDRRAFLLDGFLTYGGEPDLVSEYGASVSCWDETLLAYCESRDIDEIVVAIDERRRNHGAGGGLPLDELTACRIAGIDICDVQTFIERESCKIDVDLLRPSWIVFADGFNTSLTRAVTKRTFDVLSSLALLLVTWPIMLVTAALIQLECRFRHPTFYRQERVGLDGKVFHVIKFRSMRPDAEAEGQAQWAQKDDPRVTTIGAFIRSTRIDELPQLFNVLKGDMSFVGPRPERPQFVSELAKVIPYYDQRHRVKPGITGWAQLCYPYGASVEDAKEKLQFDLYYLKNHSTLLDLIILLQTIEVVLVGEGAR